jgi:radical SAM superfamily enzyme YgiQ (UPF0313 family)
VTPAEWEITVIDENLAIPDYASMPSFDLVGITAFTSQADRAYKIAAEFRSRETPVVMGGIHASMCPEEASQRVDAVVSGEAESIWKQVLNDAANGSLRTIYEAPRPETDEIPIARHDLLPHGYHLGSIQTTRGCPLNCKYCSVTAFNGGHYRRRPIEKVIEEFKHIREKQVLIVDDNLIGIGAEDISFCKELFRAMIAAKIRKKWVAQVTINMADHEELLHLASEAGCIGIQIGFESPSREGLLEIDKGYYARPGRDFKQSVRRIQRHGILVGGGFMIGLDVHDRGIGRQVALAAQHYGLDVISVTFLTPLPGTRLWAQMRSDQRVICNRFPEDWRYYTLTLPVARFMNLSWAEILEEMQTCYRTFYSYPRLLRRFGRNLLEMRKPIATLGVNLSCRRGALSYDRKVYQKLDLFRGEPQRTRSVRGLNDGMETGLKQEVSR